MLGEDACLGFVVQKHGDIKEKLSKTSALLTDWAVVCMGSLQSVFQLQKITATATLSGNPLFFSLENRFS